MPVILTPVHFRSPARRAAATNRVFFGVAAALCLGATSAPANAFCRALTCTVCFPDTMTGCPVGGVPLAWVAPCVSYSVYREGSPSISHDQLTRATDLAFRAWRETTCPGINKPPSIAVTNAFGPAWCDRVEHNWGQANANLVIIRDPWEADKNLFALTTVSVNRETGEIYDVDIEINGTQPLSVGPAAGRYDLQSLLTHEAGHFLGLAHSPRAGATMFPTQMPGVDDFYSLDGDDIAGICAIYPPERSVPACDPTPLGGFSPECALDPAVGPTCSLALTGRRSSASAMTAFLLGLGVAMARLFPRRRAQKLT